MEMAVEAARGERTELMVPSPPPATTVAGFFASAASACVRISSPLRAASSSTSTPASRNACASPSRRVSSQPVPAVALMMTGIRMVPI